MIIPMDCNLPENGLLKPHFGVSFQGQPWIDQTSGGGNLPEVAIMNMVREFAHKPTYFKEFFKLAAEYLNAWGKESFMWMGVYGGKVTLDGTILPFGTMLEFKAEPMPASDNIGMCIVLTPGKIGFSGQIEKGQPVEGIQPIYGSFPPFLSTKNNYIYTFCVGARVKVNGADSFAYAPGPAYEIKSLETFKEPEK